MFMKKEKDDNNIIEITYDEYSEKIQEEDYNIFLFTSPSCSHCLNYKPYVNYVAGENNLTVYNLNLDNLTYEQYVLIHDSYNAIKDKYNDGVPSIPTPVTVITKNNVEVTSILGNIGESGHSHTDNTITTKNRQQRIGVHGGVTVSNNNTIPIIITTGSNLDQIINIDRVNSKV